MQSSNVLQVIRKKKTDQKGGKEGHTKLKRDLGMAEPASQGLFNSYDSNGLITYLFTNMGK